MPHSNDNEPLNLDGDAGAYSFSLDEPDSINTQRGMAELKAGRLVILEDASEVSDFLASIPLAD